MGSGAAASGSPERAEGASDGAQAPAKATANNNQVRRFI